MGATVRILLPTEYTLDLQEMYDNMQNGLSLGARLVPTVQHDDATIIAAIEIMNPELATKIRDFLATRQAAKAAQDALYEAIRTMDESGQ